MIFTRIALRNVFRNKRRTAFSLGVIILGVSILYLVIGFVGGSLESVKRNLISQIGAVQIAHSDYFENATDGYEHLLTPGDYAAIETLLQQDARLAGYTAELNFAGLVGNRDGSTPMLGTGLIPRNGIQDYASLITQGTSMKDDGSPQIIIDEDMAETLGVTVGDQLNIATGTVSGSFYAVGATVSGIFLWNSQTNAGLLGYVNLSLAQKLLKTDGVDVILIQLQDFNDSEDFAITLQQKLTDAQLDFEVRPWQELSPFYESIRQFWGVFSGFTTIGVFVLVFFSVLEVLTMSFLERTREVGTVRAIGTYRSQLFRMFLLEGALVGFIGGILGVVTGIGLSILVNSSNIMWLPPGALEEIPVEIQIGVTVAIVPMLTAIFSTLLSAIYPSLKNARMNIVRALNYA
jgi:putative ABC transport system permease protein